MSTGIKIKTSRDSFKDFIFAKLGKLFWSE